MADTYTVKKGDTLSEIAAKLKSQYGFSDTYDFVNHLINLNNITDGNFIVVGQTIKLSGEAEEKTENTTSRATIKVFGLQSNTDRTMYATWDWDKDNTENYKCLWHYATGDGIWFVGSDNTSQHKQSLYTAPSNATKVKFKVKPVSKSKSSNGSSTTYWTSDWSTAVTYNFSDNPPTAPTSAPTVSIEKYKLTATYDNLDVNGTHIQFQIVENNRDQFSQKLVEIVTGHAEYVCKVHEGSEYKVRARSKRGDLYSDWSGYSSNYSTPPAASSGITTIKALSETSVQIDWESSATAKSYELQYTTKTMYFDSSTEVKSMTITDGWSHAEITGLTSGETYYFRVRAVNESGQSDWCEIKSVVIGKKPAAPTTWSSTTTAIVGEELVLYWMHNSQDASTQNKAELEIYFDNTKKTYTVNGVTQNDEDVTNSYKIDTTAYSAGTKIKWRVRTSGITGEFGDWSTQRTITIYATPTLSIRLTDSMETTIDTVTQFPFYVICKAGPSSQNPVSYHISIISNETYETVDNLGNPKTVGAGSEIFSRYVDDRNADLKAMIAANHVNLDNNVSYTVNVTVAMNSGLTAKASADFDVAWNDIEYEPNAEISIDEDNYSASIMPYCQNNKGVLVSGVKLSVYRREFDGSFTEIETGIRNTGYTTITDPHPALDYARYRIVATTDDTGAISYCDLAGIPVNCNGAIIQWDEQWSDYNNPNEDVLAERPWGGSMLKLPYNLDVSDNHDPDVVLIAYQGREHNTSYYGTQVGHTSTWNVVIDKTDTETLYALRRLAKWMGDVYVREPSGSGYWANVKVSYNQKHNDVTIPVSLSITRVSGGV